MTFLKNIRITAFVLSVILMCGVGHLAWADQAEVKEIARNNNCPPKKIDVYQQSLGSEGQIIYRVQCNLPKTVGDTNKGPDALLIACRDSLCQMLRPYQDDAKK